MCSHALAVAEKRGVLENYLCWYEKCRGLSISAICREKLPQKPQKKPGHKDRLSKKSLLLVLNTMVHCPRNVDRATTRQKVM